MTKKERRELDKARKNLFQFAEKILFPINRANDKYSKKIQEKNSKIFAEREVNNHNNDNPYFSFKRAVECVSEDAKECSCDSIIESYLSLISDKDFEHLLDLRNTYIKLTQNSYDDLTKFEFIQRFVQMCNHIQKPLQVSTGNTRYKSEYFLKLSNEYNLDKIISETKYSFLKNFLDTYRKIFRNKYDYEFDIEPDEFEELLKLQNQFQEACAKGEI